MGRTLMAAEYIERASSTGRVRPSASARRSRGVVGVVAGASAARRSRSRRPRLGRLGLRRRAPATPAGPRPRSRDFSASLPLASAVASPARLASGAALSAATAASSAARARVLADGRRARSARSSIASRSDSRIAVAASTRRSARPRRREPTGIVVGRPGPRRTVVPGRQSQVKVSAGRGWRRFGVSVMVASPRAGVAHRRTNRANRHLPKVAVTGAIRGRRRPTTARPDRRPGAPPDRRRGGRCSSASGRPVGDVGGRRPDDGDRLAPRSSRALAQPVGHRRRPRARPPSGRRARR